MSGTIENIQRKLSKAGYYDGEIDGIWGNMSEGALDTLIASATDNQPKLERTSSYRLSNKSLERLSKVHSDLQRVVKRAIEITDVDFMVGEGLRSLSRQRQLVAKGASQTMNSRHLTGHAVDLIALDEKGDVTWHWNYYWSIVDAMEKSAKELGIPIEAGARWKSFPDGPHYQLPWAKYPK